MTFRDYIDAGYAVGIQHLRDVGMSQGEAIARMEEAVGAPKPKLTRLEAARETARTIASLNAVIKTTRPA